jgi:hypothetical protein
MAVATAATIQAHLIGATYPEGYVAPIRNQQIRLLPLRSTIMTRT